MTNINHNNEIGSITYEREWQCEFLIRIRQFESRRGQRYSCLDCSVQSGRGLCVRLITRPEKFYRVCCVQWVWSRIPVRGREGGMTRNGVKGPQEKKLSAIKQW